MQQALSSYHIFYTVAECGSFSAAARALYISQPAVSKAVAKLEEALNTSLFYRLTKGVKLTEAGEILYKQLTVAFQAIENGEAQLKKQEAIGAGHLSIGVSTTLCKYVLLPYLKKFIAENPHVKLTISCRSTYETIDALKRGALDIGLVGETEPQDSLCFMPLKEITDVFVATKEYLAGKPPQNILRDSTLLLLNQDNMTRQHIDSYLAAQHIHTGQIIEVSTMDLLIDFAKTNLGVACVIKEFVEKELNDGTLVLLPEQTPIPERRIGYAYCENAPMSAAMKRFLACK